MRLGLSFVMCLLLWAPPARSEDTVRVIVNASNPVTRLERAAVSRIFLARQTRWEDGRDILVFQPASDREQKALAEQVHRKTSAELKRYWLEFRYSTTREPVEKKGDASVVAAVAKRPQAIGYVTSEPTDPGVKVVEVVP